MCSHRSKLRNHITKLQQDVEQLKFQVVNLEEENKRIQSKRFTIKDTEHWTANTPKAHQLEENRKKAGPERKTSVEEEFL